MVKTCKLHNQPLTAFGEKEREFVGEVCIQGKHIHSTHTLVGVQDVVSKLKAGYYQAETELQRELETAKTVFAKKLIQSRESRAEMMHILKRVVEEIENGLTEDDSAFEKFLINIKETDRVVNNSILGARIFNNEDVLLYKDKDSLIDGTKRLREQYEHISKQIRNFEDVKVGQLRDIKYHERKIRKYIKETGYNILSYHPDTFKMPKKMKEFSLLTSNQASSLVDYDNQISSLQARSPTNDHMMDSKFLSSHHEKSNISSKRDFYSSNKFMSKSVNKNISGKFKATMPTVREDEYQLDFKTSPSQHNFGNMIKNDHEIKDLAEKIKSSRFNFETKQTDGIGFTNKIRKISRMIDVLAQARSKTRRSSRRKARSVARKS